MRYEETNDIATIVVEATDERGLVMDRLSLLSGGPKPTIVVLPEDAVLRRPGDLRELKQVASYRDRELILVIEGNERLRLWARRQGFTVFGAVETCVKTLRADLLAPVGEEPAADIYQSSKIASMKDAQGETYSSDVAVIDARKTFGFTRTSETGAERRAPRTTEPLLGSKYNRSYDRQVTTGSSVAVAPKLHATTPMDLAFIGDPTAIAYETMDRDERYPQIKASNALSLYKSELLVEQRAERTWDTQLLWLLALLILGMVGGVGFSYLHYLVQATS